jgi:DNA-binding beta-propeller fold protein YncE
MALPGLSAEQAATWFADSKRILFAASEPGKGVRLFVQEIDGGKPRPVTPEGISTALPGFAVSPDGRSVAAVGPEQKGAVFPVDGGQPRPIPSLQPGEFPLRYTPDGRAIYVWKRGDLPARISRLDLESGKRETWKDLLPADPAGVERISNVLVTPDGKGYAYCYARLLSDLFVVEGLK